MSIEETVGKMKTVQNNLLEFLEDESDAEDKYEIFINFLSSHKIDQSRDEFGALLQLINSIGNNHQRVPNFISKLERLLRYLKKRDPTTFFKFRNFRIFWMQQENPSISY